MSFSIKHIIDTNNIRIFKRLISDGKCCATSTIENTTNNILQYALNNQKYEIAELLLSTNSYKEDILNYAKNSEDKFTDIEAVMLCLRYTTRTISAQHIQSADGNQEIVDLFFDHTTLPTSIFHPDLESSTINNAIAKRTTLQQIVNAEPFNATALQDFLSQNPYAFNWAVDTSNHVLFYAIQNNYLEAVKILLDAGAVIDESHLQCLIRNHSSELFAERTTTYIKCGYSRNLLQEASKKRSDLKVLLTAEPFDATALQDFLTKNPYAHNWSIDSKISALAYAMSENNENAVKILLDAGASISNLSINYNTKSEIVELLFSAKQWTADTFKRDQIHEILKNRNITDEVKNLIISKTGVRITSSIKSQNEDNQYIQALYNRQQNWEYFEDMFLYADLQTKIWSASTLIAPIALTYGSSLISESYGPLCATTSTFAALYSLRRYNDSVNNAEKHQDSDLHLLKVFWATTAASAAYYAYQLEHPAIKIISAVASAYCTKILYDIIELSISDYEYRYNASL